MSTKTLKQEVTDNPEMICFTCERSEVWPASIEGPEEIVCKHRLYPDNKRCLRHEEYMVIVGGEDE